MTIEMAETIVEIVAKNSDLSPFDLKGRERIRLISLPRQIAMYLIRQETDLTLASTGMILGGRTPATITHGYQLVAGRLPNNEYLNHKVRECLIELNI